MRARDKAEILAASALLPVALALFSGTRTLAWVRGIPRRAGTSPAPAQLASAVDRVLDRAPALWHHTCLRRAVILTALLRRAGRDAEVVMGVRRAAGGRLEAHAWIRCDGIEPYLEPSPVDSFATLRPAGA